MFVQGCRLTLIWLVLASAAVGQRFELPPNFDLPFDRFDLPDGGQTIAAQPFDDKRKDEPVSALDKESLETRQDLLEVQKAAIEVAEKVRECTVALELGGAMGSGVIISEDGYILTAAHVVGQPGEEMQVRFPSGRITRAKSLGLHTSADGALAKITEDFEWPFAPLATKEQAAETGDWCLALGHPGGFDLDRPPPVRLGRVMAVYPTVMRTDCPIMGGDSGGPLFDLKGRVIGIHSRISEDMTDNLHVPSDAYHEAWDRMLDGEKYPVPTPSRFLSLLDANQDGLLTKDEQKSKYHARILDRLEKEFELEPADEISIKSVAQNSFKWRSQYSPGIQEVFVGDSLGRRNHIRGTRMKHLTEVALREADEAFQDSNRQYVNDLTVRVYADGRRVALGTIVDRDGLIVTKASRLTDEELVCRLPDRTRRPASIVARDEEYDLALLKVEANDLSRPIWNMTSLKMGQFVAVPENGGTLESLGVVGVPPRKIQLIPARMGVGIDTRIIGELRVNQVFENSGAERAGLQVGDALVKVDDQSVKRIESIHKILDKYRAGDEVSIIVLREGEELPFTIRLLSAIDLFFPMMDTWRMSGPLSRRRDGFDSAFQIDAIVKPQSCGGPVVDLNGHLVGVTLARASRVATYVIGTEELQDVVQRMQSKAGLL